MSIIAQKYAKIHAKKLRYSGQKLFLSQLAYYANDECEFFWSMERLAREWGLNIKTVYRRFQEYTKNGILEVTEKMVGKFKRIKTWRFVDPNSSEKELKKEPVQDLILPMLVGSDSTYVGSIHSIYENQEKEKKGGEKNSSQDQNTPKTPPPISPPPEDKKPSDPFDRETVLELNKSVFEERLGKKQVTIERLYQRYLEVFHKEPSVIQFRKFIETEKVDKYSDKPKGSTIKEFAPSKPYTQEDRQRAADGRGTWMSIMRKKLGM